MKEDNVKTHQDDEMRTFAVIALVFQVDEKVFYEEVRTDDTHGSRSKAQEERKSCLLKEDPNMKNQVHERGRCVLIETRDLNENKMHLQTLQEYHRCNCVKSHEVQQCLRKYIAADDQLALWSLKPVYRDVTLFLLESFRKRAG